MRPELSATAWMCRAWAVHAREYWQRRLYRESSVAVLDRLDLLLSGQSAEALIAASSIVSLLVPMELSGVETAVLVVEALPELDEHPDVIVDNRLDMDYRPAGAAPSIEFSSEDGEFGNDWFSLGITVTVGTTAVPVADVIREIVSVQRICCSPTVCISPRHPGTAQAGRPAGRGAGTRRDRIGQGALRNAQRDLLGGTARTRVVDEQLARWQERMSALASAVPPHRLDPPNELRADLRDYQRSGYDWLNFLWDNELGGILADGHGPGQDCAGARAHQPRGGRGSAHGFPGDRTDLVVANWAAECRKFAPGGSGHRDGHRAKTGKSFDQQATGTNVVVTSHYCAYCSTRSTNTPGRVIFDEAQFIKNHRENSSVRAAARFGIQTRHHRHPDGEQSDGIVVAAGVTAPGLFPSPVAFTDSSANPSNRIRRPSDWGAAPADQAGHVAAHKGSGRH